MRARWVATAIALMLSCYGLIGRAEAYLVNVEWKFICSDEPQKFWQIYLPYWQHFCSVENGSIGANAAIRGNDTDTQPVISLFFWNMAPNAVRFEWRYLTPTFSLIFFRRGERVGRTFQRVFWSPTLRAGELASMDGRVDQLLKPIARVFVVPNVCSRNTVDHIQRGYFSNVAAMQFYKKRDAFFSGGVGYSADWIYSDRTDESGIQGHPGPEISLSSLSGMGESLKAGRYGVFGGLSRSPGLARLSDTAAPSYNPQPDGRNGKNESEECNRVSDGMVIRCYKPLPNGFAFVLLFVAFVGGGALAVVLLGIQWCLDRHRRR